MSSTEIVIACADNKQAVQRIANQGQAIKTWLKQLPKEAVIGMEATGRYHALLADCAVEQGLRVYVINPKHLSQYAKGVGQRGKTDPLDAQVIARYVAREGDMLHPYILPPLRRNANCASKYPPAKLGALVLLAPQRGEIVKHLKVLAHTPNFS